MLGEAWLLRKREGIISSLGDTTYSSIRSIAEYIVQFVENHSDLEIPRPDNEHAYSPSLEAGTATSDQLQTPAPHERGWVTCLALVFMGITTTVATLLFAEYVSPETVHSIPVINTLVDCNHVAWHYIFNLSPGSGGSGSGAANIRPEPEGVDEGQGIFTLAASAGAPMAEASISSGPSQSSGSTDSYATVTPASPLNVINEWGT